MKSLKNVSILLGVMIAIAISVIVLFPTGPRLTKVQFNSGKVDLPDWMVRLKKERNNVTYFRVLDLSEGLYYAWDKKKIEQTTDYLLEAYQLAGRIHLHTKGCLQFGLKNNDDFISIPYDIDNRQKIVFGETWASYDLYHLIIRDNKYDLKFFDDEPKKESSEK